MTPLDMNTALSAVDAALDSGAVAAADPEERRLQELALALTVEAPEAEPGFAASLDERVAAGFPRERRPRRPAGPALPRPKLAALGVAASALLALAVVVALDVGGNGGTPSDSSRPGASAPEARGEAAPRSNGGASSDVIVPPELPTPDGGIAPGERARRIERSASLTLAAPADRLDSVADGIVSLVDRRRGFVLRSSLTTGDEGTTGGSFDLRVPSAQLQATLRDLSQLGDVRARTQSGQDVTKGFVSVRDRLRTARTERRGLLRRLERADSEREARAIRERLNLVSGEIRGLVGELRNLRERTDYAAVSVTLVEKDGDDGGATGGSGTGDAVDDALGSLVGAFNIAVRILGVAIPLALVGALAWLAAALLRRRRREAALG
jgi:hypothetical protein